MFISEISTDGVKFSPLYVEGRLRNYTNLNNALNGSKQILKNPKKHCICVRILDKDTNKIVAYVRKTETGYDVNTIENENTENTIKENKVENKKEVKKVISDEQKVEDKFNSLKKPIADLDNKFSTTFNRPISNSSVTNNSKSKTSNVTVKNKPTDREKIAIDDLVIPVTRKKEIIIENKEEPIENKNEDKNEDKNENRVVELQKAHDEWKEKKESGEFIKVGDSVNNISDNHNVKKVNTVYSELMNKMVFEAIQRADLEKLFRLEFLLSKSGYSWYPKNGKVEIDSTENVVNMLKEHPELLENRR